MFCQLKQMLYFCSVKTTAKGLTQNEMCRNLHVSHSTNITITGYRLPICTHFVAVFLGGRVKR